MLFILIILYIVLNILFLIVAFNNYRIAEIYRKKYKMDALTTLYISLLYASSLGIVISVISIGIYLIVGDII